jgi:hypothetical protein
VRADSVSMKQAIGCPGFSRDNSSGTKQPARAL